MTHTTIYNSECHESENCECTATSSIPFLDTSLTIKNKRVIVDLYRKPTDRNMHLLTSSCHPNHVTNNIPYSLALRIVRICSEQQQRDIRLEELKQMLVERDYKKGIVDAAINKARAIPRTEALKRVVKNESNGRQVLVVTYHPSLP